MTPVILLALASTTCAAISTVLKHHSANRPVRPCSGGRLRRLLTGMVANPLFVLALVVDGLAVVLQILALRAGDLSTVQPILTLALVISLGLDHLVSRTRLHRSEVVWSGVLVAGLVLFLVASDAAHPRGGLETGRRDAGLWLAAGTVVAVLVAAPLLRRARPRVQARAMAVVVAAIYASTAALITSCTRIFDLYGVGRLALSWQLWTLVAAAAVGVLLNQHVFSLAPLHVTLPVIASLDPLFSIVIGRVVFDERLRATPVATVLEIAGLALLLLGVMRLSRSRAAGTADTDTETEAPVTGA